MPEVPIIGEGNTNGEMPPDPSPVNVFQKACLVVQDAETGACYAIDWRSPIDTFQESSPNDVINMLRRAADGLLQQEQAAVSLQTNMQMAQRMQEHAQTQQLIQNLNLKGN